MSKCSKVNVEIGIVSSKVCHFLNAKQLQVRCAQWMMRTVFRMIRLKLKTSECEKNVTVVSTVTGCDVCKDNTSKDPLSHCSHDFRESRHRCVHRSARRLLTHFNHLCSELIKLTSQHLDFLSRCHRHSISQYHNIRNRSMSHFQKYRLRYHASVEDDTKRVQSALCTRMRTVLT